MIATFKQGFNLHVSIRKERLPILLEKIKDPYKIAEYKEMCSNKSDCFVFPFSISSEVSSRRTLGTRTNIESWSSRSWPTDPLPTAFPRTHPSSLSITTSEMETQQKSNLKTKSFFFDNKNCVSFFSLQNNKPIKFTSFI